MSSASFNLSRLVIVVLLLQHEVYCIEEETSEIAECDKSFIPPETSLTHSCRYRDLPELYPPNLWRWIAGYGCYNYSLTGTRNYTFPVSECKIKYNNEYYTIFYTQIGNIKFLYDHTNGLSREFIKIAYASETFFDKWVTCAIEAESCCNDSLNESNVYPTDEYPCPAMWDGWHCFPQATAGSITKVRCSTKAFLSETNNTCTLFSEKECFTTGEWNQTTDTNTCIISTVYKQRHNFHVVVLYISTAFALPAVIIFFALPKLRILRVILHRNLLLAVVCRNIISIATKSALVLNQLNSSGDSVVEENTVACRVLVFFENVAKNAIFTAMVVDGFYLHKLIVRVFAKDPNQYILHGITIAFSVIPTLIWAIFKANYSNDYCWLMDTGSYHWAIDGYRLSTLIINLILLVDILRVLWLKLAKNSTASYVKSNLRVTIFLLPLFGVHFLIVADTSIAGDTCVEENIYYFASYSLEALQGVLIALGFCYLNSEVHRSIKTTFFKTFPKLRIKIKQKNNTDMSIIGDNSAAAT